MRKQDSQFGDPEFRMPVPEFQDLTAMQSQALANLMDGANNAVKHAAEMNSEISEWGKEQWDSSIAAAKSLSECRSLTDAYGVQMGIMRGAVECSLRHGANMLNLTAKALSAAMTPVGPATRPLTESLGEVRRRAAGE